MSIILTLLYMLVLIYAFMSSTHKGVVVIVMAMFAIPFCSNNDLFKLLSLGNIGGFNLNIILLSACIFFIFCVIRYSVIRVKEQIVLLLLLFLSYFIGLMHSGDLSSALVDYNKFFLQIIWGASFYLYLENCAKFDLFKWNNLCFFAMTVGCLVYMAGKIFDISVIYHTLDLQNADFQGDELLGVWFTNCLIIPLGAVAFQFGTGKKVKSWYIHLFQLGICMVYVLFFQQSRIAVVGCIAALVIGYMSAFILERRTSKLGRKIVLFAGVAILGVFCANILLESGSYVVERLLFTDIFSDADTLLTRVSTFEYYLEQISYQPIEGYGFGINLPLVNQFGRIHGIGSFYTDNALVNVAMKSGVISLVIFLMFFCIPIFKCITIRNRSKRAFGTCFGCLYLLFFIAAAIFTGQINHNYMCNFFSVIYAMILYSLCGKQQVI